MSEYKVDFAALPWQSPIPGLRFRARDYAGRRLRLVEYTPEMEPHWCDKGHIGYILNGRFEIRYEDEIIVYEPGDGIFIPDGPEHRHMGRVLSDCVRVVFVEDS